jgi:hypothetical protein
MSWLTRRLDHLGSAAFGAVGGLLFSQAPAFTQAYLQRLGGHVDEARRTVEQVTSGELLPWLAAEGRASAAAELQLRLDELQMLQQRLLDSPDLLRPLALLRHGEWSIVERASGDFAPAVPLDLAALTWTGIGIFIAAMLYELLCRAPIGAVRWQRQRRAEAAQPPPPESNGAPKPAKKRAKKKTSRSASKTRSSAEA